MRKNKIMIMGGERTGKTMLANALNGIPDLPRRTSHMIYGKYTLDVPGSYLECPWMYQHPIAAQQDACCVLMLCAADMKKRSYPPGFAESFRIPVLGVITKVDLGEEGIRQCEQALAAAGVKPPYHYLSVPAGVGVDRLKETVFQLRQSLQERQGKSMPAKRK